MVFSRTLIEDADGRPSLKRGQLVVLAAFDSAYVQHAVALAHSLESFSPGESLLLHVVNPTPAATDELRALKRELVHTRLTVSAETVDLSGATLTQRRTYYACARFERVRELLDGADCDFLVLDADSLVVARVDRDFTDKPEAEICLRRRDLTDEQVSEEFAVAAGAIWVRATDRTRKFFASVVDKVSAAFADGSASWYLDQKAIYQAMNDESIDAQVRNIKGKYADWDFGDKSIVWQAKGSRKYLDVRYLLLSGALSGERATVRAMESLYNKLLRLTDPATREPLDRRLESLMQSRRRRVVLLLPRLDLPWKRQGMGTDGPPPLAPDTLELRLWWKRLLSQLANECERAGLHVEIQEIPAWEITRDRVESLHASVVLVPHRCRLDFEDGLTPVVFYMQEYFRWLFVIDRVGWSAASSVYPVDATALTGAGSSGAYDEYRRRLAAGQLGSKFSQPARVGNVGTGAGARYADAPRPVRRPTHATERWDALRARWIQLGEPDDAPVDTGAQWVPSIFVPMQIPHDQSIRYFSDFALDEVLEALIAWGERAGVAVVLKPHPANPGVMKQYMARHPESTWLRWRDENIHDLIDQCSAVFTVNSGVGFEALLHGKPVVTFGRAEYDCVTTKATLTTIDEAWATCMSGIRSGREQQYRTFFDWFVTEHAVDLSLPDAAARRLAHWAAVIAAAAHNGANPARGDVPRDTDT
jgi:hypothetical protein